MGSDDLAGGPGELNFVIRDEILGAAFEKFTHFVRKGSFCVTLDNQMFLIILDRSLLFFEELDGFFPTYFGVLGDHWYIFLRFFSNQGSHLVALYISSNTVLFGRVRSVYTFQTVLLFDFELACGVYRHAPEFFWWWIRTVSWSG